MAPYINQNLKLVIEFLEVESMISEMNMGHIECNYNLYPRQSPSTVAPTKTEYDEDYEYEDQEDFILKEDEDGEGEEWWRSISYS